MKAGFKTALKIYKYLVILFTIGYWIYMPIDDYNFIEKYWDTNWKEYLTIWFLYFIVFLMGLTIYYWLISSIIIVIYYKLIKR